MKDAAETGGGKRNALPGRRQNLTRPMEFDGQRFTITIGYYPDGRPGEVFASGHRESGFDRLLSDGCVLISLALQLGHRPADLLSSLGTLPVVCDGDVVDGPASPLGLILGEMVDRPELAGLSVGGNQTTKG